MASISALWMLHLFLALRFSSLLFVYFCYWAWYVVCIKIIVFYPVCLWVYKGNFSQPCWMRSSPLLFMKDLSNLCFAPAKPFFQILTFHIWSCFSENKQKQTTTTKPRERGLALALKIFSLITFKIQSLTYFVFVLSVFPVLLGFYYFHAGI